MKSIERVLRTIIKKQIKITIIWKYVKAFME